MLSSRLSCLAEKGNVKSVDACSEISGGAEDICVNAASGLTSSPHSPWTYQPSLKSLAARRYNLARARGPGNAEDICNDAILPAV